MLQQLLGCSLIAALLQEHANTLKSADVLLTWEQHFMAKKQFEVNDGHAMSGIMVMLPCILSSL